MHTKWTGSPNRCGYLREFQPPLTGHEGRCWHEVFKHPFVNFSCLSDHCPPKGTDDAHPATSRRAECRHSDCGRHCKPSGPSGMHVTTRFAAFLVPEKVKGHHNTALHLAQHDWPSISWVMFLYFRISASFKNGNLPLLRIHPGGWQ